MRHKDSRALFDYWTEKRGNRPAPNRTDIEPAAIRQILPSVFICELGQDNSLTFRLAGTAICNLFTREIKGSRFADMWLNDGRRNADRNGTTVATGSMPAVLTIDGLSEQGAVLQAEMLLLPIVGTNGEHNRLIGLISVFDPPYWIGHDALLGFSTTGIRFMDQEREPVFLANRPEIEMPAAKQTFFPARPQGNQRKFGHLTVYDGGRRD